MGWVEWVGSRFRGYQQVNGSFLWNTGFGLFFFGQELQVRHSMNSGDEVREKDTREQDSREARGFRQVTVRVESSGCRK